MTAVHAHFPEHPILMGPAMIAAKRAGIKHMTRRTTGLSDINVDGRTYEFLRLEHDAHNTAVAVFRNSQSGIELPIACPYGGPGHQLWWREGWHTDKALDHLKPRELSPHHARIYYNGDYGRDMPPEAGRFRAPFHLPRWAARYVETIKSVKIERVRDISAADARLEGIMTECPEITHEDCAKTPGHRYYNYLSTGEEDQWLYSPIESFFSLWAMINGPESLADNPWNWVIEFERKPS